jgi:hypothetical protein
MCFLVASDPLIIIVVSATAGLWIAPWQPQDIRPLDKRLGRICRIVSN